MVKFIMVLLVVMSSLYLLTEAFDAIRVFRKGETYKQKWYRKAMVITAISYIITVMIMGL